MSDGAASARSPAHDRVNRRLLVGIGVSVLLHALVLSLRFGVPGLSGLSGSAPISVRIAASEPAPADTPLPPEPLPPLPALPEPPRAPVTGMRLVPPRPVAPPVAVVAEPPPAPKVAKPRKARRVSSPAPRPQVEEPPRVIAQDAAPNDFLVAAPQPEESEVKTLDPLETQHGGDEGKDNVEALALAEQEEEQRRLAAEQAQREAERQLEAERLAREAAEQQAEQDRLAAERVRQEQLAQQAQQALREQERLAAEQTEQERLARERAERERLARERAAEEQLAREREQQRLAQERMRQEQLERERAEQERLARQQAEQQRLAQERAAQERQARERAEQERLAQQRAPQVSDDPFGVGPGAGGQGGGSGPGAGGSGQPTPRAIAPTDLANRARDLVKGLDLLKGAPPAAAGNRRIVVGAAERDVPLRLYVDSWRTKIERTGAVHYPKSWASSGRADPLVSVAVRSDGTVEEVTIIRSSGRPDMDDRVRQIVRLNARYAQFPPNIAARYDVIDIRRIWRFDDVLKLMEELP